MTNVINDTILEQLNTLILIVNKDGLIEYVSPSAKKMLGYDTDSLLGNGWWNLTRKNKNQRFVNRSEIVGFFNNPNEFKPTSIERVLNTSDGNEKWILWNVSITDQNKLIGIGNDITKQKLYERDLAIKNKKIEESFKELKQINKNLTDSIVYAKRIQSAIMPDENGLNNYMPGSFIFYKPKDIVSGDLYWYHKKGNKLFIAAIDCTGHGVPGAIMSVMANSLMRDTIIKRGIEHPGDILHAIDIELLNLLSREDQSEQTYDGMDIGIIAIDFYQRHIEFAGAFRPLIINRGNELIELKGSKYPIGFYHSESKFFETQKINYQTNDQLYLFTDGITDQFGGEKNKKFNRKRFYELLHSLKDINKEDRKSFIEYAFNNWKQHQLQTDDILIIGLNLN
jgi:PAS domain S-box-containing protein